MNIGIVYGIKSGSLRRWIIPDNDTDLILSHPTSPGEAMLIVDGNLIPKDVNLATPFIESAIQRVTGKKPITTVCDIVDKLGVTIGSIQADPDIDSVPDCVLVPK